MEVKKAKKYDLNAQRPLFLGVGFALTLFLTLSAFEWRTEISPIVNIETIGCGVVYPIKQPRQKETSFPPITLWKDGAVFTNDHYYKSKRADDDQTIRVISCDPSLPHNSTGGSLLGFHPIANEMPYFPNGMAAFYRYIQDKIVYPTESKANGIEGRVFIGFIVEKDGKLSNLEVLRSPAPALGEEALRVMKGSPPFIPGKQRGMVVRTKMVVPIHFQL